MSGASTFISKECTILTISAEYIGQLEGEIAIKTNECNELRMHNQALMDENARSRAFIEKLLRHPAFHPFLEDLSREQTMTDSVSSASVPSTQSARTKNSTEANAFNFSSLPTSQQENIRVGMTLLPERTVDLPMPLLHGNPWPVPNMDLGNFQMPQVFSVLELPQGPAEPLDVGALSGKTDISFLPPHTEEDKTESPTIELPAPEQASEEQESTITLSIDDLNDPHFALYINAPSPAAAAKSDKSIPASLPSAVMSEKASHYELVISSDTEEPESNLAQRLERMCARMQPVMQRIEAMTSHFTR